ncbi:MAG: hypothetical protein LC797_23720 [Chloroflexi bacterium]|nr:hypothetical protein [Chloroflexota bacterium]
MRCATRSRRTDARCVAWRCARWAAGWPQGTAILYQDLLTATLRDLEADTAPRGARWRAMLGTPSDDAGDCPACRVQTQAEERYLTALLATVAADPSLLDGADGTCVRHTRAAQHLGGAGAAHVVQQTCAAIEHVLAELGEVIRKEDYRFRHEPRTDGERTAPSRAVARMSGLEGLT